MKLSDRDLRDAWREGLPRTRLASEGCPESDLLVRAAAGELTPNEREPLVDHLLTCADCAEEYRLARELVVITGAAPSSVPSSAPSPAPSSVPAPSPAQAPDSPAEETGTNDVRDVRETHVREPLASPRRWRWFFSPAPAFALAAIFLLASLGLIWWVVNLRAERSRLETELAAARSARSEEAARTIAESQAQLEERAREIAAGNAQIAELRAQLSALARPQPNAPLVDLLPPDATRGEATPSTVRVDWPNGAQFVTLILHTSDEARRSDYEVEVIDQAGNTIAREAGLRKSPDNTFTLILPRSLLASGQYRLRLFGIGAGRRERLEQYSLRVN